jgi:hypothetical protein
VRTDPAHSRKRRQRARTCKTDRQSFRLGGGEYERPPEPVEISVPVIRGEREPLRIALGDRERTSLQHGRRLFFAACREATSEFVEHLETACAAPLKAVGRGASGATRVSTLLRERPVLVGRLGLVDRLRYSERPWLLVKVDNRYRRLREALEAWAKRFNLRDEWLMDLALGHLCPLPWNEEPLFSLPAVKSAVRLSLIPWDPSIETRTQARARMQAIVEQHLDQVEEGAKAQGLELTPERRQVRHFHWLAGYQTSGWSQNRIAEAARRDRAGVVRAIHDLADFLGLTLRPMTANDPSQTVVAIRAVLSRIPLAG